MSFILDTDLAIPVVLTPEQVTEFGIPTTGMQGLIEDQPITPKIGSGPYYADALGIIVTEIAPMLNAIRIDDPTIESAKLESGKKPKMVIDVITYDTLPSIARQFYVKDSIVQQDRYAPGDTYADIMIPGRGSSSGIIGPLTETKTHKVRGQSSQTPVGCKHLLVRLIDGSLLELYTLDQKMTDSDIADMIKEIVSMEPLVVKKFYLSRALTVKLGRPAYDAAKLHEAMNKAKNPVSILLRDDIIAASTVPMPEGTPRTKLIPRPDLDISESYYEWWKEVTYKLIPKKYEYQTKAYKLAKRFATWTTGWCVDQNTINRVASVMRVEPWGAVDIPGAVTNNDVVHPVLVDYIVGQYYNGRLDPRVAQHLRYNTETGNWDADTCQLIKTIVEVY